MAVAMSYIEGYHILFDERGVSLHRNFVPGGSSTIVVLQDAFSKDSIPQKLYRSAAPTYVVQATSPQICRYRFSVKDRSPVIFVMTPWRREELVALLCVAPVPPRKYS